MSQSSKYSQAFLSPISSKQPAGEYLRYEPIYDELRAFEESAQALFTQSDFDKSDIWAHADEIKISWTSIIKTCEDILKTQSKDLQVAVWLLLAKAKHEGIIGLQEGVTLIYNLLDTFWDTCHPQPNDGDYDVRLGVIKKLRTQLGFYASIVFLAKPSEGLPFNYIDYQMAYSDSSSVFDQTDIEKALASTDSAFFEKFISTAQKIKETLLAIDALIDGKKIDDDSSFLDAIKKIETITDILPTTSVLLNDVEEGHSDNQTAALPPQPANSRNVNLIETAIESRKDAFLTLRKISRVLKDIEPHSMLICIIDEISQWEHLSPHKISQKIQERGFALLDLIKMFPEDEK